jgi:hypothetical protein
MDLQVIVEEIKREWKEDPQKSKDESEVISKYGNMFNPKNIDNLTIEDFRSFLNIKNNKHWRSLERLGHAITDDLGKLKNTLKILLDETIPIEERIRRIRDKNSNDYHKWFGSAYYTPILLVVYPKKYPVINEIVKDALQKTGLYPNYDSKPEWRAYAEVIPKIQQLAEQYHLSLWQIDSVWWKYQMKNDVAASGTKESILEPLEPSLWLIRAGDKGQGAQTALENNCVGIGYGGLPGLHLIKEYEKLKEHYKKTHPEDN